VKPLGSIEELLNLREQARSKLVEREKKIQVKVHLGTCGIAAGGNEVFKALQEEIERSGRKDIKVVVSGCAGLCSSEPNVTVGRMGEDAVIYCDMDAKKMRTIFQGHILGGEIQSDHALARIKQFG